MTITNGYATLAAVKWRLDPGFTTVEDERRDLVLEQQVQAISRVIDSITGHRFYATTETRYYTPENERLCYVDDLLSLTSGGLYTDPDGDLDYDDTWATTDYLLMPHNATTNGWPYSWIETHPTGIRLFPAYLRANRYIGATRAVKITGSFGFCATGSQPDEITEACLLAVEQLFKRKDAIFGVTGPMGMSFALKVALKSDPHIMVLLEPYIGMI